MKQSLWHWFNRWSDIIIGSIEDHTLEQRTARTACFLAVVLGTISVGINLTIHAPVVMFVANVLFCIIFLSLYIYIYRNGKSKEVYWIIIIVCNATFATSYVHDEGAFGPMMYFWMFLVMFVS